MFLKELSHFISCVRDNRNSDMVKKEEILTVLEILEEVSFGE